MTILGTAIGVVEDMDLRQAALRGSVDPRRIRVLIDTDILVGILISMQRLPVQRQGNAVALDAIVVCNNRSTILGTRLVTLLRPSANVARWSSLDKTVDTRHIAKYGGQESKDVVESTSLRGLDEDGHGTKSKDGQFLHHLE